MDGGIAVRAMEAEKLVMDEEWTVVEELALDMGEEADTDLNDV
jgi:hypothetical protein